MTTTKMIYIAGYGRSGSTLMDILLGAHPKCFGGGELNHLFDDILSHRYCSCGDSYYVCPFWSNVLKGFQRKLPRMDYETAHFITTSNERLISSRRNIRRYGMVWRALFEALREQDALKTEVIVDSSKSSWKAWRRPFLVQQCGTEVFGIHLVRDPRAVMFSVMKGSNRRMEAGENPRLVGGAVRGLLGWCLSNSLVENAKAFSTIPFMTLRYEDLVHDPASELSRVADFLALEMTPVIDRLALDAGFDGGHGVSGNRMRRRGTLRIRADDEWRRKLPPLLQLLSIAVLPLYRRYRYGIRKPMKLRRFGHGNSSCSSCPTRADGSTALS